jgi:glycerophosphoryl diester phosphodiesterase
MSRSAWLALVLSACGGSADPSVPEVRCPDASYFCGRPRNIAHRGGSRLAPENTLPAFANAVATGADVLELDVRRTADDVVVLLHDPTVDRTTDGVGDVGQMTFAELQQLDAGYQFTADGGASHPFRGMGIRVPTLEQVLDAFPDAYFNIEIKDAVPTVAPVLALIEARGIADHVLLASIFDEIAAKVRTNAPDVLTSMTAAELLALSNLTAEDEASYVAPAPIAQPPYVYVTPEMMATAKRHHLIVHVWTVDDRETMVDFLARGVDGIITNDPVLLHDVLAGPP